jgi:hypothetical protein
MDDDEDESGFFADGEAAFLLPELEKLRDAAEADPWKAGLWRRLIELVEA